MIDIHLLRTDLDGVAKRLATRGFTLDARSFSDLENRRKEIQTKTEQLQAQRNAVSKKIGHAKAQKDQKLADQLMAEAAGFGDELKKMEADNEAVQAKQREFVSLLPNLLHEGVPLGKTPEDNKEVRKWGEPKKFDFKPKD